MVEWGRARRRGMEGRGFSPVAINASARRPAVTKEDDEVAQERQHKSQFVPEGQYQGLHYL